MNKRIAFEDQLVLGVLAACLIVAVIGSNQARFEQICSNGISNHQGQPTSQGDQNPNTLNPSLIHGAFLVGLAQGEKSQNNPCQNAWSIVWPWGWPSSDVWQAIFDFLLVIVGWRTWTVYDRQRRIMGEQNTLMKRQIALTEDSLTINRWPYAWMIEHEIYSPISLKSASTPSFIYKVRMDGNSPAILRAKRGKLFFSQTSDSFNLANVAWTAIYNTVDPGFCFDDAIYWGSDPVPVEAKDKAAWRTKGFYFYAVGQVIYDDIFGNQHEFGFCYKDAFGSKGAVLEGGKKYNYRRRLTEKEQQELEIVLNL